VPCAGARQACKFFISEAVTPRKNPVGPLRDAAEVSESEEGQEEREEEETPGPKPSDSKGKSVMKKVFNKLASPLQNLGKRKTTELSPGSIQERQVEPSERARGRPPSPSLSLEVPIHSASSPYSSSAMPPPSTTSYPASSSDPFFVRSLEYQLRESQEDLAILSRRYRESQEDINLLLRRQESRDSLLREEIATLKARLGEGSSGVSRSSEKRRGAGGSSGRH
jgi:hypothetical protein